MSLKEYTQEQIENMSLIELTMAILAEEKKALNFHDIFNRIAELKGFSEQEKENKMAQFYTDLNIDGRFTTLGSNVWGLKRWYPIDQAEEEVHTPKKKKKATKRKKKVEDIELEEEEFLEEDLEEELDDEFDDIEDEDLDEDLDDEELEEDLDEDLDEDFEDEEFEEIDEEFDEEFEDEEES